MWITHASRYTKCIELIIRFVYLECMTKLNPLQTAIDIAGSQSALSRLTGVPQPTLSRWLHRYGGRVSAEAAVAIERATGVSRQELRPDLWSEEAA